MTHKDAGFPLSTIGEASEKIVSLEMKVQHLRSRIEDLIGRIEHLEAEDGARQAKRNRAALKRGDWQ